jgi:hypothetical protein
VLDEKDGKICIIIYPMQRDSVHSYFRDDINPMYEKEDPKDYANLIQVRSKTVFIEQRTQNGFDGDHVYLSSGMKSCGRQLLAVYNRVGRSVTGVDLWICKSFSKWDRQGRED